MIGRLGWRTMEMNGGTSASYLARARCVPLFCALFYRGGNRRPFRLSGEGGDHFHCTVEPYARSYSVSKSVALNQRFWVKSRACQNPRGPKDQTKIDRGLRDWKFRAIDRGLEFSIEPFSVDQRGPGNRNSGIEIFDCAWKFRSGLKISSQDWNFRSGFNFFDRRALWDRALPRSWRRSFD